MSKHTLRQLIRLLLTTNFSNRRIAQLAATSPNTVRTYRQKLSKAAINHADPLWQNRCHYLKFNQCGR